MLRATADAALSPMARILRAAVGVRRLAHVNTRAWWRADPKRLARPRLTPQDASARHTREPWRGTARPRSASSRGKLNRRTAERTAAPHCLHRRGCVARRAGRRSFYRLSRDDGHQCRCVRCNLLRSSPRAASGWWDAAVLPAGDGTNLSDSETCHSRLVRAPPCSP